MSGTSPRTPESLLRTYFSAKDENRPHVMPQVFCADATLEMVVKSGAIAFPPISRGIASITDVLVRKFGQTYENVYSFYLERPPLRAISFSCDWMVGMSEKSTGSARVGCGRYDWHFQAEAPWLVDRLGITIEAMLVLPSSSLEMLLGWLTRLPYPWCEPSDIARTAPAIDSLEPVLKYVCRGKSL